MEEVGLFKAQQGEKITANNDKRSSRSIFTSAEMRKISFRIIN